MLPDVAVEVAVVVLLTSTVCKPTIGTPPFSTVNSYVPVAAVSLYDAAVMVALAGASPRSIVPVVTVAKPHDQTSENGDAPVGPDGPVGPVTDGPVGPVGPDPDAPVDPVGPVTDAPVGPAGPVTDAPAEPVGPVGPVAPVAPDDGPVGPSVPLAPVGPVAPVEPEPVAPVGPVGPVGPVAPVPAVVVPLGIALFPTDWVLSVNEISPLPD